MKKILVLLAALAVAITYVNAKYTVQDAVAYAHAQAHPKWTPLAQYYAGYYLVMRTRYAEAVAVLEPLLEAYPESSVAADAAFRLGNAYEGILQIDQAKELYEKYLETNPQGRHSGLARRKLQLFKAR